MGLFSLRVCQASPCLSALPALPSIANDLFTWIEAHTRDVVNTIKWSSQCRVCLSSAVECAS